MPGCVAGLFPMGEEKAKKKKKIPAFIELMF